MTAAFVHMYNLEGQKIKTFFVALSSNITVAFGGELTVGYYWTNRGENGMFGSVAGTVGIDMGIDAAQGEMYGDPSLLDGGYFSSSGSFKFAGGGIIMDSTGNTQIGDFYGYSYGVTPLAYHQSIGYGSHTKSGPIYESVDNRTTIPYRRF